MPKCIIYTSAYNAEKTIENTIQSVICQTNGDWIWYLVDNGSTDGTGRVIREFAKNDSRIIPLENKCNHIWEPGHTALEIAAKHDGLGYFCWLDADDEYKPEFLEKMLMFVEKNQLEIAFCGSDFVEEQSKKLLRRRLLPHDIFVEGEDFSKLYVQYFQFARTLWAKLFSLSLLKRVNVGKFPNISYGWDTLFVLEALKCVPRFGILSESLHTYYVSKKSMSYQFDESRLEADGMLYDYLYEFLTCKCGTISFENIELLWLIYLHSLRDTMELLLNSQLSVTEKYELLRDIFISGHMIELIQFQGLKNEKTELISQVAAWILAQKESRNGTGLDLAAEILSLMDFNPTKIEDHTSEEVFLLLAKVRDKLIGSEQISHVDEALISVTRAFSVLSGLSVGFLTYFRNAVCFILSDNEVKVIRLLKEMINEGAEIPDEYVLDFLMLGLNLSAKLQRTEDFIYFKKLQISLLIESNMMQDASRELADWDQLLPDDHDFKTLRERIASD